jgi:hypothetical protein
MAQVSSYQQQRLDRAKQALAASQAVASDPIASQPRLERFSGTWQPGSNLRSCNPPNPMTNTQPTATHREPNE